MSAPSLNLNRSFSRLTRDQKREIRSANEELDKRYAHALADLSSIKLGAGKNSHADPLAAIQDLQEIIKFSAVPKEYKRRPQKQLVTGIESIVKADMTNENYHPNTEGRSHSTTTSDHHIVDVSKPLPLSFEARKAKIMKAHVANVESSIAGLFSKNPQTNPAASGGPVPDLYTPLPTSRRFEIEAAKQAALEQMIAMHKVTKSVPQSHAHQLCLLGKKAPKGFIPSCGQNPTVGSERENVKSRVAAKRAKDVAMVPFK